MAHFRIENLNFTFPGSKAATLSGIDLEIGQGAYVVLCGNSGSGKSTLLHHFKTVLTPYGSRSGQVYLDGVPLEQVSARVQAQTVGFVMQDPEAQLVTDKVWHELAFGMENLGVDPGSMGLRVAEMADFFGIRDWMDRDVAELSGGQKQLLNLAAVMAMHPEVLILDEPTSQLDPIAAADFLATLRKINLELGTTVILTEHRLEEVFHSADRVIVLEGGRILADDSPRQVGTLLRAQGSELFDALPTPTRIYYQAGGSSRAPLTVREGRSWLTEELKGTALRFREPQAAERHFPGPPAVCLKNCRFRYEKNSADILKDADLEIPAGCICAIMGGNGAGKSTLLKCLCGICRPYRGKVELLGKDLRSYPRGSLYRGGIGMLPQDPRSLFTSSSVRAELAEMEAPPERMAEVIRLCQLEGLSERHPYDLSGGEQQRLALGKVLLTDPRVLLLDEPTKGLDHTFKKALAALLRALTERGITVVLVSHDVEFCAEYADLVTLLFHGAPVTTDTPRRFFGQNSFYTTAANRMSRCCFRNAVTAADVAALIRQNREDSL